MADNDRQPPQAHDTVTPAGVGATTSNVVSPGTIQEILNTGDSTLIDQAFDQMTVEDMWNSCPPLLRLEPLPPLG